MGFLQQTPSPWSYVTSNALLQINQGTIGSVLDRVTEKLNLNGSLWSLEWEFLYYVTVLVVGILGLLKRWRFVNVGILAIAYAFAVAGFVAYTDVNMPFVFSIVELGAFFWAGGCAYLFRDSIPMRWYLAIIAVGLFFVGIHWRWSAALEVPSLTYLVLYAGMKLPIRSFDRRVDLSYGLYIYAYPTQQLLAIFGASALNPLAFFGLSFAITSLFATASWFGVERNALTLKHIFTRHPSGTPQSVTSATY
jgi:peptidoglycan/LPS O-acetylase OafA/YrhL